MVPWFLTPLLKLFTVKAPADVPWKFNKLATDVAQKAFDSLEGAEVFAVELFLTEDGQAEDEKTSEAPSSLIITSLPEDDVFIDILARVPRRSHVTLSLVSKHFGSLVASPDLYYARRSLLACTENCLYVALFDINTSSLYHWYILCRKANGSHCLVRAPSTIPFMYYPESSVAVGSRIYVFGGVTNMTTNAFCMDCRSHTVTPLPSIPVAMICKFVGFIDGKIYVIGYLYHDGTKNVMMVFDIETQKWEHAMIKPEMEEPFRIWYKACVVMADKIYIKYRGRTYVYKPVESKWETNYMLMLNNCPPSVRNASVVDDVLLYHDRSTYTLRAYDPNEKYWRVVEGLKELLAKISDSQWSRTVNYGGNMALLFRRTSKIWCAEISLERLQGGQIWGKVEWCDHVLTGNFGIRKFLAVAV
ncbi:F-box/kelch-repeat protein At4g38940-like isoform X2 [Raphanus sativus]|uniref:F-box/kelch-repeat protein At4g38940-like isoform X2 n=1 Tax=Raphanus sativus TaxID=3726 RepID=A0A9W3BWN5_RAPSA|nr:F-box/kelch-repeat protein At4g38940-like isoform X2 [Raphanus sativus]